MVRLCQAGVEVLRSSEDYIHSLRILLEKSIGFKQRLDDLVVAREMQLQIEPECFSPQCESGSHWLRHESCSDRNSQPPSRTFLRRKVSGETAGGLASIE